MSFEDYIMCMQGRFWDIKGRKETMKMEINIGRVTIMTGNKEEMKRKLREMRKKENGKEIKHFSVGRGEKDQIVMLVWGEEREK